MPKLTYKINLFCLLCCLLFSGGCSDNLEHKARNAYETYKFDLAWDLASELGKAGRASGFELLALMSVQGLGREADIAGAYSLAEQALALDPAYSWLRGVLDNHIEASVNTAEEAFDRGDYARSLLLATPAAKWGHERALELSEDLTLGQYVPYENSELAWRTFWRECSGNTRFDTPEEAVEIFQRLCSGRKIIWDGYVIRSTRDSIKIKMLPGRARVRHDLILNVLKEPDYGFLRGRKKIRFSGIIDSRGSESKEDQLINGEVIGLAPLTRLEKAQLPDIAKQDVMSVCQKLALEQLEKDHMPTWSQNFSEEIKALSPEAQALFVRAGIVSEEDVFQKTADGGWEGRFEGQLSVHSRAAAMGTSSDFTAHCSIAPRRNERDSLETLTTLSIISVSEPDSVRMPVR